MKNTTWFVKREESIHEEKYLEYGIHRQIRVNLFSKYEIRDKASLLSRWTSPEQ